MSELQLAGAPVLGVLLIGQALAVPVVIVATGATNAGLVSAIAVLAIAAALPAVVRECFGRGPGVPRRLSCLADGRLRLDLAGGTTEEVRLLGRSVVLGPWRVLLLQGPRTVHRVLVEAPTVPAAARAALGRALARLGASPETGQPAVRSLVSTVWEPGRPAS